MLISVDTRCGGGDLGVTTSSTAFFFGFLFFFPSPFPIIIKKLCSDPHAEKESTAEEDCENTTSDCVKDDLQSDNAFDWHTTQSSVARISHCAA
mmetsp:Transcript_486/g.723  ORF Transcript_486/g.723 Transcript_486/m.723 type:complete len:94 (+) Transcript_486:981-1262(+)